MQTILRRGGRLRITNILQRRLNSTDINAYRERYAGKIQERLQQMGMKDIEEFKNKMQKEYTEKAPAQPFDRNANASVSSKPLDKRNASTNGVRKDSSPVTPLSDIMDLSRFAATPHTGEQIGVLWNAYHSAKANAGKGYLSAAIPKATYESFLPTSRKYPSFIVPLPRPNAQIDPEADAANSSSSQTPYEFYYMEWAQHPSPPSLDSQTSDLFAASKDSKPSVNPPCTTVIFTPLQEYKLRQSFAVPHLVLTHYTDLAHTHDIVLMRGEMTIGDSGRTLLSSSDAQLLAFGVQQFYLGQTTRGAELLKIFHEKPDEFSWEELISISQL